jgi:pSer/pThr/pTyr-binding forkhead associated (FHA) protein
MSPHSPERSIPAVLRTNYPMSHGEAQQIDIDTAPLTTAARAKAELGIRAPIVARISAADHDFSVVDMRHVDKFAATTPLLIVDSSYANSGPNKGRKGIWLDRTVTIGRSHHADRFEYSPMVSREHFSVVFNGLTLVVKNFTPTNSTLLSGDMIGPLHQNNDDNIFADFSAKQQEDIQDRFDFGPQDHEAPYGYYKNHPIIGRRTSSVKNGVYFTTEPNSEAVIVDDKSKALQRLRNELAAKYESRHGAKPAQNIEKVLKEINSFIRKVMPYSDRTSDRLSKPLYNGNKLIGLSEYVDARGGVCRHQCLLAAFLAESLIEKGILEGQVGVERNRDVDAHGAHAWAIFKTLDGQTIVIDPAQNYVGTKQQARKEGRWKYDLPVDS